jgi:hypothetical protein
MQEFSSVTASSYDAESLAPLLNEKAADGWSVVSIVAAGTNIVAYLQRDAGDHATEAATDHATGAAPAVDDSADDTTESAPAEDTPAPEIETPFIPVTAPEEAAAPVDEPAGWATAPDEQTTESPTETAETSDASIADLAAQVSEPEPEPQPEPAAEAPAAEAAPAAESAVPAGWYADPSGRFELRYWDGTAWTEHVSRAGQQFTDPPVA